MNAEELQAVRTFLEGLEYRLKDFQHPNDRNWLLYVYYKDEYGNEIDGAGGGIENEANILKATLEHYLSQQLGIHWRKAWKILYGKVFSPEYWDTIQQAIVCLNRLEKGETE